MVGGVKIVVGGLSCNITNYNIDAMFCIPPSDPTVDSNGQARVVVSNYY